MAYSCAMIKTARFGATVALTSLLLLPAMAHAEPAWISDQFEITLRSGPSTSNAIQLMLRSGTQVEVLERDADSGYSRVRTGGGTEGWVLTRYLMREQSRRIRHGEPHDRNAAVGKKWSRGRAGGNPPDRGQCAVDQFAEQRSP